MEEMLCALDQRGAVNSHKKEEDDMYVGQYVLIYGFLSSCVHARMSVLCEGRAEVRAWHATLAAIFATLALLQVICDVAPDGGKQGVQGVKREIGPLIEGCYGAPVT